MADTFEITVQRADEAATRLNTLSTTLDRICVETAEPELRGIVTFLEGQVKLLTPHDTGVTRDSIESDVRVSGMSLEGIVFSSLPQTPALEFGRAPGSTPPPYRALVPWVKKKFGADGNEAVGIAIAVAKTIGKKGFQTLEYGSKQRMFEDAWNENAGDVARMLERIGVHVSAELLRTL